MKKQLIMPGKDTTAGPYSPGLAIGEMVFVSGQAAVDPDTGEIVPGSIEEQTEMTLSNMRRILEAAGATMNDCVKITVYLRDMAYFQRMNSVFRTFFNKPYATRTTVQAVLYPGIEVEIDAIALRGSGSAA